MCALGLRRCLKVDILIKKHYMYIFLQCKEKSVIIVNILSAHESIQLSTQSHKAGSSAKKSQHFSPQMVRKILS